MRSLSWQPWEGVFQYLACVEYSRTTLDQLPRHQDSEVEARYHSAGLIFFAQATLDLIARWLKTRLGLSAEGANIAFHKTGKRGLANQLKHQWKSFDELLSVHKPFINKLNEYRMSWIHKLSGGTVLDIRGPIKSSERSVDFVISKDPSADFFGPKREFLSKITDNNVPQERHLYTLSEFTNWCGGATKTFVLDSLEASLRLPNIEDEPYDYLARSGATAAPPGAAF